MSAYNLHSSCNRANCSWTKNQNHFFIITNPISQTAYSWVKENKAGIGYDSVISVEAANELYKLAPTMISGKMTPDELMQKLGSIQ